MNKRNILLALTIFNFAIGFSQTDWTGKFKLAFDQTDKSIIYLQVVPDNTGNGDIVPGTVAYIQFPANTGYTVQSSNGTWTVSTLATISCGMVIECNMETQYPSTSNQNSVTFTQGVPFNLITFKLSTSICSPEAAYRMYENSTNVTDPCVEWNEAYLDNGLGIETNSDAYSGNLTTFNDPLICPYAACAWKTISSGDWTTASIWQFYDCTSQTWVSSPVAPNNDTPIYIYHNVDIPVGTTITTGSIINIEPTGKLDACGTLNINNQIVFKLDASGNPGELNNCGCPGGTVTMGATARRIVRRPAGSAWSFISFPFDVLEDNIFEAETTTPVIWEGLSSSTAQLFAVEYDGLKQATTNSSASNFINVDDVIGADRALLANKGYLVTNDKKRLVDIDFTSVPGTQFNFCTLVTLPLETNNLVTTTDCNCGWNFVGRPYTASYDLNSATSTGNQMQIYVSGQYENALLNPNNLLHPFSAFFVQVPKTGGSTTIAFPTAGQQLMKGVQRALPYDDVLLEFSNGINTDRTSVRLKEDGFAGLDFKEDGSKMISSNTAYPQIYTEIPGACPKIAVNTLPLDTQRVDLKVRTGTVGTYTIKLTDATKAPGLKKIVLVDAFTGIRTDLLQTESYTYENTETGTSDRFYVLFSNDGTTGINTGNNDGISIITKGKNLNFSGLKGVAHVNMYDVVGKLIYQYSDIANNQSFDVNIPGVYMVDISTETQKARIKVLINNRD